MLSTVEKEMDRNFYQLGFTAFQLNKDKKKQLLSMLKDKNGKTQLPQKLVNDSGYIVSEDYSASILFEVSYLEEWLEALQDQDQIIDFYIVTDDKRKFAQIKSQVIDILGTYSENEPEIRSMLDGFKANCEYFKLAFLDKTSVALGRQFRELLPVLWMKSGAVGRCPALENDDLPNMLILPQNKMAVLVDEIYYSEFDAELSQHPEIQTVFIVTDSETAYRSMIRTYDGKECYQLYRDYLDNFRINTGR